VNSKRKTKTKFGPVKRPGCLLWAGKDLGTQGAKASGCSKSLKNQTKTGWVRDARRGKYKTPQDQGKGASLASARKKPGGMSKNSKDAKRKMMMSWLVQKPRPRNKNPTPVGRVWEVGSQRTGPQHAMEETPWGGGKIETAPATSQQKLQGAGARVLEKVEKKDPRAQRNSDTEFKIK